MPATPNYYMTPLDMLNLSDPSVEALKAAYDALAETFIPIPQAQQVGIADTVVDGQQRVVIAFVYSNASDAQAAAEALVEKIRTTQSIATRRPFGEILNNLGVT